MVFIDQVSVYVHSFITKQDNLNHIFLSIRT